MSMNVEIIAERPIIYKDGQGDFCEGTQTEWFNVLQTRTEETNRIIATDPSNTASQKRIDAYIQVLHDWGDQSRKLPVYAKDDHFHQRDPIGFERYDPIEEHLQAFDDWVTTMRKLGYVINVYSG